MRFLVVLFPALLSACASIPPGAISYAKAPAAPDGFATIYFYRIGAYPTLRKPDILVSGVKIYEPPELAYTWVHVKAGERKIKVAWAWDTGWPPVEFTRSVVAGESYYFKISGSFENKGFTAYQTITQIHGSSVLLVPAARAESELAQCCKYIKAEAELVK